MAGIVFGCMVPHPPIIVPDIGKGGEREISATTKAMEKLADQLSLKKPEAALIISPHGKTAADAMGILTATSSSGDFSAWGATGPRHKYSNDIKLVELIQQEARKAKIPITSIARGDYDLDWGVMVPMHFLNRSLKGVPLVPLTFSWLPLETHFAFGKAIRNAAEQSQKRVALIASGDLSHRLTHGAPAGYDPLGKIFDEKLAKALSCVDIKSILNLGTELIERAGECGLRSAVILLGALDGLKVKPEILSYEGPFGVGYLVASFEVIS
jgi:aromatic ring-opening dioxygenase LigB subunit